MPSIYRPRSRPSLYWRTKSEANRTPGSFITVRVSLSSIPLLAAPTQCSTVYLLHTVATLNWVLPGYGTVTPYMWGMEKDRTGNRTRGTFLICSLQNIHSMSFLFPTSGVPKMSMIGKCPNLICFVPCCLIL